MHSRNTGACSTPSSFPEEALPGKCQRLDTIRGFLYALMQETRSSDRAWNPGNRKREESTCTMAEPAPAVPTAPTDRQINLRLSDLRNIFHEVDRMAANRASDREIFHAIAEKMPFFELRFLRWLVRHTLHPESEDDIMPDEVSAQKEHELADGTTGVEIHFTRVPPTVAPYQLVQYMQQFWHVVEFNGAEKRARLKQLSACPD